MILGTDRSAIGTLVERSSRFTMLLHLPPIEGHNSPRVKAGPPITGAGAGAVRNAIAETITTLPEQLRRSLTWDQGIEIAQHVQLRFETGLQIYFCDPRSPWQRGTNKNTNGLLRQYFPRGTDLARHSAEELEAVAAALKVGHARHSRGEHPPGADRVLDRRGLTAPATSNASDLTDRGIPGSPGGVRMAARGYRRSGPPSGRASTTTAASPRQARRLF